MVQHCDAMSRVYGMVERQHCYARSQHNVLCQGQGLGYEKLWHRGVFPRLGYVLAYPCLVIAKAVGLDKEL